MDREAPAVNATGTGRRIAPRSSFRRSRRLIAFGWYGGKFSHLDFILPHIPEDARHFCDVYGGSAAVLMNLQPYPVETWNDIDSELVNFFRVLRDRETELVRAIGLTPFSREELIRACEPARNLPPVERARRFYVRARQTRTGPAQKSSEGRWAHCVLTSRAGMAGAVSRWLGSVEALPEIAQCFQRAQIDASALDVIRRYDTAETVFYPRPTMSAAAPSSSTRAAPQSACTAPPRCRRPPPRARFRTSPPCVGEHRRDCFIPSSPDRRCAPAIARDALRRRT